MSSATAFLKKRVLHSAKFQFKPLQPIRRWSAKFQFKPLQPIRRWLDSLEMKNPTLARRIARLIPDQCPFERDVVLFGHTIAQIPPMCKLNPLYDEVVGLRFRALCFLADECGEDISALI